MFALHLEVLYIFFMSSIAEPSEMVTLSRWVGNQYRIFLYRLEYYTHSANNGRIVSVKFDKNARDGGCA